MGKGSRKDHHDGESPHCHTATSPTASHTFATSTSSDRRLVQSPNVLRSPNDGACDDDWPPRRNSVADPYRKWSSGWRMDGHWSMHAICKIPTCLMQNMQKQNAKCQLPNQNAASLQLFRLSGPSQPILDGMSRAISVLLYVQADIDVHLEPMDRVDTHGYTTRRT